MKQKLGKNDQIKSIPVT